MTPELPTSDSTDPAAPPPGQLPPATPPAAPVARSAGGHAALLLRVRRRLRTQLLIEGAGYGFAALLLLGFGALLLGSVSATAGRVGLLFSLLAGAGLFVFFGVLRSRRLAGDDLALARTVGARVPSLSHELLGAVELSKALAGEPAFSRALAQAFLSDVDARADRVDERAVVPPKPSQRAGAAASGALVLVLLLAFAFSARLSAGLSAAAAVEKGPERVALREPITGDVELTYRYPAYTGLNPRTVQGTGGEVTAPRGTEVELKTRSDRPVDRADLIVNGERVPMQVEGGRNLSGRFVVDEEGSYHFAFYKGRSLSAEGPDVAIKLEVDGAPKVTISAPQDELEVDPGSKVTVKYEAEDDHGLASLELVYKPPRKAEDVRLPLKLSDARRSRGDYVFDLSTLSLEPGDRLSYRIEAKDNDAVAGAKTGSSRTQTLKIYSAAEHRREALKKAEALWERLVLQLADRLEGPDRAKEKDWQKVQAHATVDLAGQALASDMQGEARAMSREKDVPEELWSALATVAEGVRVKTKATADVRKLVARMQKLRSGDFDLGKRLSAVGEAEVKELEKDVLYLETLLDRQKLDDLRELAKELARERRELASQVEQYQQTKDPQIQADILQKIEELKARIAELSQRMAELAKGIRDEHLNAEALKELMEEKDLSSALDEIERLIKEGKADEAMKKLQELAMQMEQMLEGLDEADEDLAEEQYPELSEKFGDFMKELENTTAEQERVAKETKEIRDRYREQMKERLAQKSQAMKAELQKQVEKVKKDYEELPSSPLAARAEDALQQAQAELENVKSALEADDFDLALESAVRAERAASELSQHGQQQQQLDDYFQNPQDVRQESKKLSEQLARDAKEVTGIREKLESLFPAPGSQLSEADRQKMKGLAQEQRKLEKSARNLQQRMDEMQQMAPLFDEEAEKQMEGVGQRMSEAGQRLEQRDPQRGSGEQRAALEGLQRFQRQMQENGQGKKGKGLPLPMLAGKDRNGFGKGTDQEKVEIPEEDPGQAPKEFRKDLLDAMKQGAPEKYRDQVKRYYEELVK